MVQQLQGLVELVRHNAFHYGVAYIRLLGDEDVLAAEFIGGQHIVGEVAVIRRAFIQIFLSALCSVEFRVILFGYLHKPAVERQEQLSDKVQFCDGKTAVMENAERREARLEKEKAAEKATGRTEAKGGIHGKLEKAKAEIKAKGTDTIPKNRAKDLASVL